MWDRKLQPLCQSAIRSHSLPCPLITHQHQEMKRFKKTEFEFGYMWSIIVVYPVQSMSNLFASKSLLHGYLYRQH